MTAYITTAVMITLCLCCPPFGWLFMYKYSTFDKDTNISIACICTAFFLIVIVNSPDLDNIIAPFTGGNKNFEVAVTPEEFRQKFNDASTKTRASNLNLTIDETLSNENFSHDFTANVKLVGTVDADGKISELKLFAVPKNQDESFQVLNVLGLLIATFNPELDADDRGEVLRDLRMLKNVSAEEDYDWTTERRGVKYSVHTEGGKSTFTVTPE